ncbi:MAG: hypothetical protein DRI44_09150 [Chlamydiae bacterium]|nr:MAG: hypothetical protein DRI44_09150 [Chlamydiota bacterium]
MNQFFPEKKRVNKAWGFEVHYFNDKFCAKLLVVEQGARCSIHFHKEKEEMFLAHAGKVLVELWDQLPENYTEEDLHNVLKQQPKLFVLEPYNELNIKNRDYARIFVPVRTPHRFTGLESYNAFFEASTYDKPEDSIRIISSQAPEKWTSVG